MQWKWKFCSKIHEMYAKWATKNEWIEMKRQQLNDRFISKIVVVLLLHTYTFWNYIARCFWSKCAFIYMKSVIFQFRVSCVGFVFHISKISIFPWFCLVVVVAAGKIIRFIFIEFRTRIRTCMKMQSQLNEQKKAKKNNQKLE